MVLMVILSQISEQAVVQALGQEQTGSAALREPQQEQGLEEQELEELEQGLIQETTPALEMEVKICFQDRKNPVNWKELRNKLKHSIF